MIGGNKNPDLYALNNLFLYNVGTAAARFGVGDKLNAVKTHDPWLGDQRRASESGSLSPADFSHLSARPARRVGLQLSLAGLIWDSRTGLFPPSLVLLDLQGREPPSSGSPVSSVCSASADNINIPSD